MINLYQDKDFLLKTIHGAAAVYLENASVGIRNKGEYDLVTTTDTDIEKFISEEIRTKYPGDVIIGEEYSPSAVLGESRCWIIDPIDGTVNYARGSTEYGIQCALASHGQIKIGVIYLPNRKSTFWAIENEGAFCNDRKLQNDPAKLISDSVVYVGDFSHRSEETRQIQIRSIDYLSQRVSKIRMVGAASIDYSSVAAGYADGLISITRNIWDIYPGIIMCREAGKIVTGLDGKPYGPDSKGVVIAANEMLHGELLKSLTVL